jgi:hypothetical protein
MKFLHRRRFLHLATGAAVLPVVSYAARAQAYPSRPVLHAFDQGDGAVPRGADCRGVTCCAAIGLPSHMRPRAHS